MASLAAPGVIDCLRDIVNQPGVSSSLGSRGSVRVLVEFYTTAVAAGASTVEGARLLACWRRGACSPHVRLVTVLRHKRSRDATPVPVCCLRFATSTRFDPHHQLYIANSNSTPRILPPCAQLRQCRAIASYHPLVFLLPLLLLPWLLQRLVLSSRLLRQSHRHPTPRAKKSSKRSATISKNAPRGSGLVRSATTGSLYLLSTCPLCKMRSS